MVKYHNKETYIQKDKKENSIFMPLLDEDPLRDQLP